MGVCNRLGVLVCGDDRVDNSLCLGKGEYDKSFLFVSIDRTIWKFVSSKGSSWRRYLHDCPPYFDSNDDYFSFIKGKVITFCNIMTCVVFKVCITNNSIPF